MSAPMHVQHFSTVRIVLALAFLCVVAAGAEAQARPYEETVGKRGWTLFLRPAKKNPADQMAYAQSLVAQNSLRQATRQFKALTIYWPVAPEAALAQYEYAKLLEARGKYFKAFDEYDYLIKHYSGQFPHDEVLERMFQIAVRMMNTRKGKFLVFPGFQAPERAVPLFEKILENGPEWSRAAETQYLTGQAYELSGQPELAVVAYMASEFRYPNSAFVEESALGKVRCFYELSLQSPNDDQARDEAWAAVLMYQSRHPNSEAAPLIAEYRQSLARRRAKAAYDRATYYDKLAKRPESALIEYERMVALFPDSDWTGLARLRIEELKPLVEKTHEKNP